MAGWWPPDADGHEDDLTVKRTTGKEFWRQVVESPDCQEVMVGSRAQSPWVEVKQICRTESSLEDNVDDNTEHAPTAVPEDDCV